MGRPRPQVSNFPGGRYLTYSYINPYPTAEVAKSGFRLNYTLTSDFAIAADINAGAPAMVSVTPSSSRKQMVPANSPNHNGDGQNVLYADGHVEFQNTPFCGMLARVPSRRPTTATTSTPMAPATAPLRRAWERTAPTPMRWTASSCRSPPSAPRSSPASPAAGRRWHLVVIGAAAMFGVIVVIAMIVRGPKAAPVP